MLFRGSVHDDIGSDVDDDIKGIDEGEKLKLWIGKDDEECAESNIDG